MASKRNITQYLDALVDKDGLKTELTITITTATLLRLSLTLLFTGISLVMIVKVLKAMYPDKSMQQLLTDVAAIKKSI